MARAAQSGSTDRAAPRLRRAYYDCRYGQLHLHNAIPGGGGFDELTSVICLHDAGESGRVFVPLLAPLGLERSVYALDLPGSGESDPAPGVDALTAAVHAVTDFVESMRIRQFDLIARGESGAAARRLVALRAGAVRRLVLLGDPGSRPATGSETLSLPSEADQDPGFFNPGVESPHITPAWGEPAAGGTARLAAAGFPELPHPPREGHCHVCATSFAH